MRNQNTKTKEIQHNSEKSKKIFIMKLKISSFFLLGDLDDDKEDDNGLKFKGKTLL